MPVWIHLKKKEPFAFARLWDSWRIQLRHGDGTACRMMFHGIRCEFAAPTRLNLS